MKQKKEVIKNQILWKIVVIPSDKSRGDTIKSGTLVCPHFLTLFVLCWIFVVSFPHSCPPSPSASKDPHNIYPRWSEHTSWLWSLEHVHSYSKATHRCIVV